MTSYDCTNDVLDHKSGVKYRMRRIIDDLSLRAIRHDDSKIGDPVEKALFDKWTLELNTREYGTPEYQEALEGMGEGVKRHYAKNRHHPEHFENGVNDMTLVDVIEMVCDWMAAAKHKGVEVNLDYSAQRFGLSEQLIQIIANTVKEYGND